MGVVSVRALLSILAVATVTGCGGASSGGVVHTAPPSHEISGRVAVTFTCATQTQRDTSMPRDSINRLLLCPVLPGEGKAVVLSASAPLFRRIVLGLATPGPRYGPHVACAAYADVEQEVLAASRSGRIVVDLPRDSCGHYSRSLLALLSQARSSSG